MRLDVLESQMVVISGLESKEEARQRRAAGLSAENVLASQLACTPINGTALFFLVRHPIPTTTMCIYNDVPSRAPASPWYGEAHRAAAAWARLCGMHR